MKRILAALLAVSLISGCSSLGASLFSSGGAVAGAVAGSSLGPAGAIVGAGVGAGVTTYAVQAPKDIKPEDIPAQNAPQAAVAISKGLFEYTLYGVVAFLIITNILVPYLFGRSQRQLPSKLETELVQKLKDKL